MTAESSIVAYFAGVGTGAYSGLFQWELNLLERAAAEALTEDFSFHPLIRFLDGVVLDDPDTSNHHVLLRRHPFEGQILYLSHDSDSRIVFSDLAQLLSAAEEAKARELYLSELHPEVSPQVVDQDTLSRMLQALVDGTQEEVDIALSLIPSMDLADTQLLEKLARHRNFYLGEAVGNEIAKRPSGALMPIARLCSNHSHAQAARAGARALGLIEAT